MTDNIKNIEEQIKQLEEQKKKLLNKKIQEGLKNNNKEKSNRNISYRSTKEREIFFKEYQNLLKLFEYYFDGVGTEEQLFKLINNTDKGLSKNAINKILDDFRIFGFVRKVESREYKNYYLISSFSIVRIHSNKNLRGRTSLSDITLKRKIVKNDFILRLIEDIENNKIEEPSYKIKENLQVSTNVSNTIKQSDITYLQENYEKINFSFLNDFKNNKGFKFISKYTSLTKNDINFLLRETGSKFKETHNFYYNRFIEQVAIVSKKKKLINVNTNKKEKDILREELRQARAYEKIVKSHDNSSLLTLQDLEGKGVYIRSFTVRNNLLHIDLDILETSTIRTTEMEYILLDINNTFNTIFGYGEMETYFININWHLMKRGDYSLYIKRVKELGRGRGTNKATKDLNNIFMVEGEVIYNQNITPLLVEEDIINTPQEATEAPKNDFKDKPIVKVKETIKKEENAQGMDYSSLINKVEGGLTPAERKRRELLAKMKKQSN